MPHHTAIIGFGRLGETLAGILRDTNRVSIVEVSPVRRRAAQAAGYKCFAMLDINVCDSVFVCVPIGQFEQVIRAVSGHVRPGATVLDVCSVKVYPVQLMQRYLPESVAIIAMHPLFGPDSIKKGFEQLTMVTWPVRTVGEEYAEWGSYWRGLGLRVVEASPDEHDRATAYTLGMTHFFGRIMDHLQLEPQVITTIGYGALYEVMEQTNRDTWELFHDMQHYNPYAKAMRDRVYTAIQAVEARLDAAIGD